MQVAITVNNSTPDQSPETTTEQTSGIQQTHSNEGLGAPAQPTTPTSAADQQELMNLLRSESAGSSYEAGTTQPSAAHALLQLSVGTAIVAVVIVVAVFCQQQLNRFSNTKKQTRSSRPNKRKK